MKGLDYALLTCKEQHFCYFRAGEVVENRSVVRHFRLGGGGYSYGSGGISTLSYEGVLF